MEEKTKEERFPSNSYANMSKKEKPKEEVKKVADGHVVQKKKTAGEKFSEMFLATDIQSISRYVIFDVLIPEIKNMVSDIIHKSTNILLFGDRRGSQTERDRGRSYVRTSYDAYYDDRYGRRDDRDRDKDRDSRPRSRNIVDDILFDTRIDAEEVLSNMVERIRVYGVASVKDLYGFANIPSNYTQDKWGWFELNDAVVDRVPGGYLLKLPKPQVID